MTDVEKGTLVFAFDLGAQNLILDKTCVGAQLDFVVGGSPVAIFLPNFMDLGDSEIRRFQPFFGGADIVGKWIDAQGDEASSYGYVLRSTPESSGRQPTSFKIQKIMIGSRGELDRDTAGRVLSEIRETLLTFVQWVEVLVFWDSRCEHVTWSPDRVLSPVFVGGTGQVTQLDSDPYKAQIVIDRREPPDLDILKRALWQAQNGAQIDLIHAFLISALRQAHRENFRHAILDVATSMEMALIRISEATLKHTKRETVGNTYFRKFRGLVNLCEGIEILSGSAPLDQNDLLKNVAQPRNRAIHKGEEITSQEAFTAITFAKDFIYFYFPPGSSTKDAL